MLSTTAFLVNEPSTNLLKITNPVEALFWENQVDIRDKKEKPNVSKNDRERGFMTDKNIILVPNNNDLTNFPAFLSLNIGDYNLLTISGIKNKIRAGFVNFNIALDVDWKIKQPPTNFGSDFTIPAWFTIVIFRTNADYINANGGSAVYFNPLLSIKVGDLIYSTANNNFLFEQLPNSKAINLLDTTQNKDWFSNPQKITNNQLENIVLGFGEKQFGHGIFFDKTGILQPLQDYLIGSSTTTSTLKDNLTFNSIFTYNYTTI
jgi:hypothetical protein